MQIDAQNEEHTTSAELSSSVVQGVPTYDGTAWGVPIPVSGFTSEGIPVVTGEPATPQIENATESRSPDPQAELCPEDESYVSIPLPPATPSESSDVGRPAQQL